MRPQRTHRLPQRFRPNVEILLAEPPSPNFATSREKELSALLQRGVFRYEHIEDVPPAIRIFNSRFVDSIKLQGTPKAYEKSRLVVQAYNDNGKQVILTQAPTVQRASQRLLLSFAVMRDLEIYSRDISQAYVQSKSSLTRDIYVRPPGELNLPSDLILKVMKPLYGIPEAGNHWFQTYHSHHINQLKLQQSAGDPCLLYNNNAVVALQTDDTLFCCNEEHKNLEKAQLQNAGFQAKDTEYLSNNHPVTFNGAEITKKADGSITMTQSSQCENILPIQLTAAAAEAQYISQRARGAYVASICQPEATFALAKAAQAIKPTKGDCERLNKCLNWQMENGTQGLRFVKLHEPSLQLIVFTDGSFAGNTDYSSQIGYVIVLADQGNNCNVIHWASLKCRRVTRSVLAAELYALATGFDAGCVLKHSIDGMTRRQIPLIVATDSYSLYECLVKLGTTREKRLMIDISAMRQSYERREIAEIVWIEGPSNPADAMTKAACNNALQLMISTNKLTIKASAWVERNADSATGAV